MTSIIDFRAYAFVKSAEKNLGKYSHYIYNKYRERHWKSLAHLKYHLAKELNFYERSLKRSPVTEETMHGINECLESLVDLWNYLMRV